MNYRNMLLPELAALLQKRKLGNVSLRNELNKMYGVPGMPPAQAAAREEAIKLLEKDDEGKWTLGRLLKLAGVLATIGGFVLAAFLALASS